MIEMQRCEFFSHGKIQLRKQALATDRRLIGVKKRHFSKILQERESAQIWGGGGGKIKGGLGLYPGGGGGSWGWNTIQKLLNSR